MMMNKAYSDVVAPRLQCGAVGEHQSRRGAIFADRKHCKVRHILCVRVFH